MIRRRSQYQPSPPGPNGSPVRYACAKCRAVQWGYAKIPPPAWAPLDDGWCCRKCARERGVFPLVELVRCVACDTRQAGPPSGWVHHRGEWYCEPCADKPRRVAR